MLAPLKCAEVVDLQSHAPGLDLLASPVWFYDSRFCSNVWGNRAALSLFGQEESRFKAPQLEQLAHSTQEELSRWKATNERLREEVEVKGHDLCLPVQQGPGELLPGCPGPPTRPGLHLLFSPATVVVSGTPRRMCMAQVTQALPIEAHQRMVEMCNNHPMFQFLFDDEGKLLAANQRAMQNMQEHLGSCENYTLQSYLSMGECDGSLGPDEMYHEAMAAIFKEDKPCHRFAQLRWSKRIAGKYRWVLYEMWPLEDPVSHKRAVLVCEQNISQVKALEDQFKRQNKRLEAQLEEALAQRDPAHKPAIDIDTPADKTLKMLDKLMRGLEVSPREAMELRDTILHAGADLRQPLNLSEQLMRNSQSVLDNEVSQSLIQLLSLRRPVKAVDEKGGPLSRSGKSMRDLARLTGGRGTSEVVEEEDETDEVHVVMAMCKEVPEPLMAVLTHVDDWQFDAFQLASVTGGRPLTALSYLLFRQSEIIDKWALDEHKLVKYLMRIEDGYQPNPYHNRVHAADVLRSLHVLIVRGGLMAAGCCDEVGVVACYLSAIIHDYEHRGVNNDFLIRMSDPLAVLYNDRSPMENHHLAAAFQLLNTPEFNFMPKVSAKVREQLRKQVIDMVLATDMKQHFAIHSMFQTKLQLNGRPSGSGGSGSKSLRTSPHLSVDDASAGHGRPVVDEDQKSLALQVALKCADLGHLASPRPVHRKWVTFLEEEFFRQGDSEKHNTLSVSPLMDREKNGITKSQVGFFDIVALPLFQSFAQAFPDTSPMLEAVKDNYHMWREESSSSLSSSAGKPSS